LDTQLIVNYLTSFVQGNQYYLEKWRKRGFSWNWGAAFFGITWLAYRKMYLYTTLIFLINSLFGFLLGYFGMEDREFRNLLILFFLFQRVVLGMFANLIYYVFTIKKIKNAYIKNPSISTEEIQKLGGVSAIGVFTVILVSNCVNFLSYSF